jgi:PPOX class probable F420-dependent enzyme
MLLSEAQRELLQGRHYAIVGTLNGDGSIQQTLVWYMLDGDDIRLSIGARSQKARNLRRAPTISLSVADGARYLTLSGTAAVEPPDPEFRRRLALRYLDPERIEAWLARGPDVARATVRMTIGKIYGQGV